MPARKMNVVGMYIPRRPEIGTWLEPYNKNQSTETYTQPKSY